MSRLSSSLLGAAVLLAGAGSVSIAQGHGHGGGGGGAPPARAPEVHESKPARMDHESPMGAAHEGMKGDKDRMGEMKRADKGADKAADMRERAARKAEHGAERVENRAEHTALREAHVQSSALLRGVRISGAERRQVREIDKRYEAQIRALRKDEKSSDKAGTDNDAAYTARVAALTTQERADIRAVLTPAQQVRFDANVAARASMKH